MCREEEQAETAAAVGAAVAPTEATTATTTEATAAKVHPELVRQVHRATTLLIFFISS